MWGDPGGWRWSDPRAEARSRSQVEPGACVTGRRGSFQPDVGRTWYARLPFKFHIKIQIFYIVKNPKPSYKTQGSCRRPSVQCLATVLHIIRSHSTGLTGRLDLNVSDGHEAPGAEPDAPPGSSPSRSGSAQESAHRAALEQWPGQGGWHSPRGTRPWEFSTDSSLPNAAQPRYAEWEAGWKHPGWGLPAGPPDASQHPGPTEPSQPREPRSR